MTAIRKTKKEEKYTYEDYKNWKDSEDWEIIGGAAYAMSPSPTTRHQEIANKINTKLFIYLEGKPCKVYYELDVVLSSEDIVKPDVFVVCDRNKITDKNIQGAPDFIVEILSPATSKRDKKIKFDLYRKFGVKEYWIVDPSNYLIEVYNFEEGDKTSEVYYYDDEEVENFIPVGIFQGELKLDLKYIFES